VGFPHIHATIITMSNNTETTIINYTEALKDRTEQMGLDYMRGFLFSTLMSLKLQSYELEQLILDTKTLSNLVKMDNQHRDNRA
jgi:hypothetical protein